MSKNTDKRVGIFSTIPVEVLFAAGLVPVDVNNLFVGHQDPAALLRVADAAGVPRNLCAWTRGLYGAAAAANLKRLVVVPRGDCTNNVTMARFLAAAGVTVAEFNYPLEEADKEGHLAHELELFADQFGTRMAEVKRTFEDLRVVRQRLHEIDELNWQARRLPGAEARLLLLEATDMAGNPSLFLRRLERGLRRGGKLASSTGPTVAVFGVPNIIGGLVETLEDLGAFVALCETERDFAMLPPAATLEQQYLDYAYPYGIDARLARFTRELEVRRVDGLVLYAQAFCHHNLEQARVQRELAGIPTVVIEGDVPAGPTPRDRIRLETFVGLLLSRQEASRRAAGVLSREAGSSLDGPEGPARRETSLAAPHPDRVVLGLDLGSRFAKIVAEHAGKRCTLSIDTIEFYKTYATRNEEGLAVDMGLLMRAIGLEQVNAKDVVPVSTGYGRYLVSFANARAVPEIAAHAVGASLQVPESRFLLIDFGGQDTKAVVVADGQAESFLMNDKCAAGSGRYVENMARLLGMPIDEVVGHYEDPVELSNVCATFGESEIIGRVVEGVPHSRIAAGIMHSVAQRTVQLVQRLPEAQGLPAYLAGGLAHSAALAVFLSAELDSPRVLPLDDPRYNGALGCLEIAQERT